MPNTKKTYRYEEQRNRRTAEQLRILDESFEHIRQRAQQCAIEQLGNLPGTATEAGDPRDPKIGPIDHQATGTVDSTQNLTNKQEMD
jgi:hypothetical protein